MHGDITAIQKYLLQQMHFPVNIITKILTFYTVDLTRDGTVQPS